MKRIEHKHTSSKALKFSVLLGGYKLSDRLDMLSNMTINLSSRSFGSFGSFNILSFGAPHPLLHVHHLAVFASIVLSPQDTNKPAVLTACALTRCVQA